MDPKKAIVARLAARFKEPSSWAGLAGLFVLFGVHVDAGVTQDIIFIGSGIAGLVAFFAPEGA
jgi:hypothetical protein